jgi:hypothetical protein
MRLRSAFVLHAARREPSSFICVETFFSGLLHLALRIRQPLRFAVALFRLLIAFLTPAAPDPPYIFTSCEPVTIAAHSQPRVKGILLQAPV